jgi:phosphoglycolate phosphatase
LYLVIFDVDGTLVDSQHMIVAGMTRAFAEHDLAAPSRDAVLGIVGLSLVEAVRKLLPDHLAPRAADIAVSYKAAFHVLRQENKGLEPLYPGARAALDQFAGRNDVLLGIATGKSKRGVAGILDLHDLHGRFVTIQTADDHPSKPHPSMVATALGETGVRPERAVMIGDSTYDITMARSAGVRALGVSWGYHAPVDLVAAGAHVLVERYEDVFPAAGRLLSWSYGDA